MRVEWLLWSRVVVFLGLQGGAAAVLGLAGEAAPMTASARWWLPLVTLGNVGVLLVLARARREVGGLRSLWRWSRATWRGDLVWFLGFSLLAAPVGFLPGVLLARALWAAPDTGNAVLFQPVPDTLLPVVLLAFPVTQALTELPLYFGHVSPGLRERSWPAWASVLVPALVLALQHAAMPFHFDGRYLLWRGLMFLPFAVLVGVAVTRRPTLLPWLMVVQGLMDVQVPVLSWLVSSGQLRLST